MKFIVLALLIVALISVNGQDYNSNWDNDYGSVNQPDYGQDNSNDMGDNGANLGDYPCTEDGVFGDPSDPSKFHQCANGKDYVMECAIGTIWDDNIKSCNWQKAL